MSARVATRTGKRKVGIKTTGAQRPKTGEAGEQALAAPGTPAVGPEERFRMIQHAAYYLAEKDGFRSPPDSYWAAAEKEIEERLK